MMDEETRKEQIIESNRLIEMAKEVQAIGDKMALLDGANAIRKRIMPIGDYTGHCPECGERVTMTANFCHSCGQRLPKHNWRL